MALVRKQPEELALNPFTTIGKEWFLLTAGTPAQYNTMTCSWGGIGVIWNEPSVTAYVRTSRYTYEFLEESDRFTICVLPEQYRAALAFCGSRSGRDCDKAAETGLHPVEVDGLPAFAEARLVIVCEKVYAQLMEETAFTQRETFEKFYGSDPMHKMYIGRILAVYEQA